MTAVDDILDTGPKDPIRSGRYYLPGPDGKYKYYTRATTIAKTLDDTYTLEKWGKRQVAIGVARTPSLAAAVNADHDNKDRINNLVDQAITAAGGTEARDLGTALHRLIERHDTGKLDHPGTWQAHIAEYTKALAAHRLTVDTAWCEAVLVNETYGIAGRVDRLLADPEGLLNVADLKTGGHKSWLAWAIQFACYATATHWWDATADKLIPIEPGMIRQDHTLAIHLPAAENPPHCQIHALSVPLGLDGLLMALEVRRMRALDKLPRLEALTYHHPTVIDAMVQMITDTFDANTMDQYTREISTPEQNTAALRTAIENHIIYLRTNHPDALKALGARWPTGIPTLKQSDGHTLEQLDAIDAVLHRVNADHGIPF